MVNNIDRDFNVVWQIINSGQYSKRNVSTDNVKGFIYHNPTDPRSLYILSWINNMILTAFNKTELLNAIYNPDILKYRRNELILNNLPFIHNPGFITLFHNLVVLDSSFFGTYPNTYGGMKHLLKSMSVPFNEQVFDYLINWCNYNKTLMSASFNNYATLEMEINRLNNLLAHHDPDDYKRVEEDYIYNCQRSGKDYNEITIYNNYVNNKMSIIGEYLMYDRIKAFKNSNFTAKELGNGFGYDLYYGDTQETLIEVKSTKQEENNTYFELTSNEFDVMINTLSEPNVNYLVFRVFFNISDHIKYQNAQILQYNKDTNSFICINEPNVIYTVNEHNPLIYEHQVKKLILQ